MPSFKDWPSCLQNGENKTAFISCLADYYKRGNVRDKLFVPLITTEKQHRWKISEESV